MHYVIDFLAIVFLAVFAWRGWNKGAVVASLGIVSLILAGSAAYLTGRYVGPWLGYVLTRPRIVMIPCSAGLVFVLISFAFQLKMWKISDGYRRKAGKEGKDEFHMPWHLGLGGSVVGMAGGMLSLIVLFWLCDLAATGISGHGIPGADRSHFGRFAHRAAYEGVYFATARKGRESQAAAIARVVSNPAKGLNHLENVLAADSVKRLLADREFANDVLSGDPERIEQNASLQALFNDRDTLDEMKEMGIFSGKEKKTDLCRKLARVGQNENIKISLQNLKSRDLLRTDKIIELIRDPDFDVIVAELMK